MDEILEALLSGACISGGELARQLGVTRAAVWKQMETLRRQGFVIESEGKRGYRLLSCPDSLMAPVVRLGLSTKWAGSEIRYFERIGSTNREARRLAQMGAGNGLTVLADEQTEGRGRRGRGWLTPPGEAVAMSVVMRPQVHPSRVALLSLSCAVAVCQALCEVTGLEAGIKWPNDIVLGGKKVCGMLLEMNADEERVHDVVAGIGINVHQKVFPEEIKRTASSLDLAAGRTILRADVVRAVLRQLEAAEEMRQAGTLMDRYRALSATLGQPVRVSGPAVEEFEGTAENVTEQGTLLIRAGDGLREVLAGDVSVRGLMGYV